MIMNSLIYDRVFPPYITTSGNRRRSQSENLTIFPNPRYIFPNQSFFLKKEKEKKPGDPWPIVYFSAGCVFLTIG